MFAQIETPAALVDVERMRENLRRTAAYAAEQGLAWRPHAKTHKTPALAALQIEMGAVGVTVATPREAEVMAEAIDDILLAYPPLGEAKLRRLMALPERVRLSVALDSAEATAGLAAAARSANRSVGVLVEVDVGMGRVGVQDAAAAVRLARAVAEAPSLRFAGILFYPGHIRGPVAEQTAALGELSDRLAAVIDALARAGLATEVVSGGSTPTQWRSHEVRSVTEIRPGTSIFNDRTTALIGACEWDQCAYSVLATVVSTAVAGQAVIDAGSKALAKEELRAEAGGYGALLDRPNVVVKALSEEHGILNLAHTAWRPAIGDRVRVVPNHVCVSVNLHERLWGVRGAEVVEGWEVQGRGREEKAASGPRPERPFVKPADEREDD